MMFTEAKFGCSYELLALAPGYARMPTDQAALRFALRDGGPRYGFDGQVAIVELVGELYKSKMIAARAELSRLASDRTVQEILLVIDSPGGTVSGTHDLHLAVASATQHKRVTVFAEDCCCSAAYWIASAASSIYLNATGAAGNIGVFQVIVDYSGALEREGIQCFVVRSGPRKGVGVYGAKVSTEALTEIQQRVDAVNEQFTAAVAKGRRMSVERVRDLADGRVLTGVQAKAAGLVDGISTFETIFGMILQRYPDRYTRLQGREAAEKFDELVAQQGDWGDSRIRSDLPELAAKADVWRQAEAERKRKLPKGYS